MTSGSCSAVMRRPRPFQLFLKKCNWHTSRSCVCGARLHRRHHHIVLTLKNRSIGASSKDVAGKEQDCCWILTHEPAHSSHVHTSQRRRRRTANLTVCGGVATAGGGGGDLTTRQAGQETMVAGGNIHTCVCGKGIAWWRRRWRRRLAAAAACWWRVGDSVAADGRGWRRGWAAAAGHLVSVVAAE